MTNIKSEDRSKKVQRALKYWTPQKLQKAEPVPMPKCGRQMREAFEAKGGNIVRGKLPNAPKKLKAQTGEVPNYSQYPFSCVGKLFMREGNSNFVGSAWVIGGRAIFSAAHCLFDDNGSFYDDIIFVPQYKNGVEPHGRFGVVQLAVDERYVNADDNLRFDLGIAVLDGPVGDDTGTVDYTVEPRSQISKGAFVTGVGYPASGPSFNGETMQRSTGRIVKDSAPGTTTQRFFGAENEMTGGCSGGPWFDPSGVVVGLNSFVFVGEEPKTMYSPYFGQGFVDLIEWANERDAEIGDPGVSEGDDPDVGGTEDIKSDLAEVVSALNRIVERLD